ncbi:hypothetical protein BN946_scf184799.g45 [Trametes cinnabarina]|uniref:Uncharacterized protein n=1 Tax=Pycnoporus cinnabarinus TaxID=5643 RepID=A0A060S7H1_PYCCI|nr:hypothetical protein BN946_scf184799.g45 [Trametes cinnabarina]
MLYRAPPPWSALPTSPAAKSAPRTGRAQSTAFYLADADPALLFPDEVASAGVTPQPSRPTPAPVSSNSRRGLPDSVFDTYSQPASTPAARAPPAVGKPQHAVGDAAPADQARRSMLALSSIQSMISIVQKRANESSKKDGTPNAGGKGGNPVVPGRANPFARRASGSGVQATIPAKRKAAEVRDEASSTAAGSKTPATAALPSSSKQIPQSDRAARASPAATAGSSRHSAEQPQSDAKVAMEGSPLPSKKLRPITSLTVPEWPSAHHKPLSHHKPKPLPAVPAKQTTLKVARRPDLPGDELQGKRKASTPVLKTPKLEMTNIDKSAKAKRTTTKSREKVAKKGGNFDWKEWERR